MLAGLPGGEWVPSVLLGALSVVFHILIVLAVMIFIMMTFFGIVQENSIDTWPHTSAHMSGNVAVQLVLDLCLRVAK